VKSPRSHKARVALAIAVIGALVAWFSARDPQQSDQRSAQKTPPIREETRQPENPVTPTARTAPGSAAAKSAARFDFYLLALSLHPAFCADGHSRMPECTARTPRPLVLHGLWPENLKPGAYPHDCPAPALALESTLAAELEGFMPGMRAGLHEHEWRKHGACSGLDDDVYYRHALELARELDSALASRLTTLAGRETSARELRGFADEFHAGLGATLTFQCRTLRDAPAGQSQRPFLIEVRQCLDNDGPAGVPGTLLDCAAVERRDQGCGKGFLIAGARLWK
jgi:ribonuclease T2